MSPRPAITFVALLSLLSAGCQHRDASYSDHASTRQSFDVSPVELSAYASSERFIAEHHTVQIVSSKSRLEKSWQSALDYCGTIRCEVLSSRIYSANAATPSSGEINLRVVPDDFGKLMARLGELGRITEHSTQREDKTSSVIDTDAQLKNLVAFRESLRAMLLKSSARVSDLFEIQKQLSETQAQIDSTSTPIHVVTRLMRHADSKVTLEHYAHIVGDAERVASEKFSRRIGQNINQLESDAQLESDSSVKTA